MNVRGFIRVVAGIALAMGFALPACADYPERPITMVITNAAGGGTDIFGRMLAKEMSALSGQPVVVENKTGAGTLIGMRYVVKSPPDGSRILFVTNSVAIDQSLRKAPEFDIRKDLTPITSIAKVPVAVFVNPAVPAKTLPELIAYMKANPGVVNYGTTGIGTTTHLMWENFATRQGVKIVHIPYQGGSQMTAALLGKQIQVMWNDIAANIGNVKTGQVRIIATSGTRERYPLTPDVPTFDELGYTEYDLGPKFGVFAPPGMPEDLARKLNALIVKAAHSPGMVEEARQRGYVIETNSVDEFRKEVGDEVRAWGQMVQDAKIELQ
jgi:tripartite-type tricarboxylate transporter receptor subunit TctC